MSTKQRLTDLRQQLERWRSHNEVYARPVDQMLYDFLSELLNLGEDEPQLPSEATPEDIQIQQMQTATNDDPPGGNNPGAPDIP